MKKTALSILLSGLFAIALSSCGGAYTPMTEEQISAKADSIFNSQKEAIVTKHHEDCAANMSEAVSAKAEELKAASTTVTSTSK
jgi:hypothetical protein